MSSVTILEDLFAHNDWANQKILDLCQDLSNDQLDAPREIGFGSLRNTIFHTLEAEKIWLERWLGEPWRPLEKEAGERSVDQIRAEAMQTARKRNQLIRTERESGFSRIIEFQDSLQNQYRLPLGDLMNHVSNHGIHHRAQALNYLRSFGKTVPAGLDYLFFKLAFPTCEQPSESVEPLRKFGLSVCEGPGKSVQFQSDRIQTYFAYSDWAMIRIHEEASRLSAEQFAQTFDIGPGSLQKTLQHLGQAERWWLGNWDTEIRPLDDDRQPTSLDELRDDYAELSGARNAFIETLNESTAQRVVTVPAGGVQTKYRVVESLLQLCSHGTHHRSQCVNMLRRLGVTFSWIDLIVWVRENN